MKLRSWSVIKLALVTVPLALLLVVAGVAALIGSVRPAPQPTPIPTWLADNSETHVDVKAGSAAHLYSFSAASATRIRLDSQTAGFAFAAQIRDAAGQTIAAFDDLLEDVQMTLAPNALYQIAVSAADPQKTGTISLALGSAVIAPGTLDGTAQTATITIPNCHLTNAVGTDVLVRSAPAAQYAVLGLLPANGSLSVIARTDDNWYTVDFAERQGWITGSVVALNGDCTALPVVRDPTIPTAPVDAPAALLQVDRDASGSYHDAISTPDGDTSDLIWVRVINLDSQPPNNYREFVLTLDCTGVGVASVRWGSAYDPTLTCGASVLMPFLNGSAQQPISVQFAPGSPQSYVSYTLSILPSTPMG